MSLQPSTLTMKEYDEKANHACHFNQAHLPWRSMRKLTMLVTSTKHTYHEGVWES